MIVAAVVASSSDGICREEHRQSLSLFTQVWRYAEICAFVNRDLGSPLTNFNNIQLQD